MRAIVQRVSRAAVIVGGKTAGEIGRGLLVYLGVGVDDVEKDAAYLAEKIRHLRIFRDDEGKLNRDVVQVGGGILVVSNFTLMADVRKGRRPAFTPAAAPEEADRLYVAFCEFLRGLQVEVQTGVFGAMMSVESANDGPINILLDSRRVF